MSRRVLYEMVLCMLNWCFNKINIRLKKKKVVYYSVLQTSSSFRGL